MQIRVGAVAGRLVGCCAAVVPGVDGDDRVSPANAEVAYHEDVAVLVGAAKTPIRVQTDLALEEPEAILGVTAVVVAVQTEVDDLAGRA